MWVENSAFFDNRYSIYPALLDPDNLRVADQPDRVGGVGVECHGLPGTDVSAHVKRGSGVPTGGQLMRMELTKITESA
jgi:hypothetical protein